MGMVNLEAYACRVPVVAFDVDGFRKTLIPHFTGLLARPYSASDLATKIQELLLDHDLRRRLGEHAHRLVAERFSIGDQVKLLEQTYLAVLRMGG